MITEKVMKEKKVDKQKAFFMLYQEGKSLFEALPAAEKKKLDEKVEAAKVKFQEETKAWKENGGAKAKVDKGPKAPIGAYAQWLQDNRPMLFEKIMKEHSVDKGKAFLMLYKEGRPVYDALPAKDRKKMEDKVEAAKVKYQAERAAWKLSKKGEADDGEDDDGEEEA